MKYTVLIYREDDPQDGFWARVAELPGCFTSGDTIAEVEQNVLDAIEVYLESIKNTGETLPSLAGKLEVAIA